jgi:hypothetical protein
VKAVGHEDVGHHRARQKNDRVGKAAQKNMDGVKGHFAIPASAWR